MTLASLFNPQTILLLEIAFIGMLLLFLWINKNFTHGIYIWLVAVLFFKYQRLTLSGSVLPDISIDRVLFIFLVGIFIVEVMTRKRAIFSLTKVEYSMFLFSLLAVISMIWTGFIIKDGGRLRIGELLTGYIFPFTMFFVSRNAYDNAKKRDGFIKFIILIGCYLTFTAIFEHFRIEWLVFPKVILDPAFGIHFGRARGPFLQAAVNGTVLGFVFVASFYFLSRRRSRIIWRFFSFLLLMLTPLAIFFTYTRAAWLAALLAFVVSGIFIFKEKGKIFAAVSLALFIVVASSTAFFLSNDTVSFAIKRTRAEKPIYDRLNLYIASLNMFVHHPFFGVGFGRFADCSADYFKNVDGVTFRNSELSEHDTFAGVMAEMGISGIALILLIYVTILRRSIWLFRYTISMRRMVIIFWGFMVIYVVNSIFIEMRYFEFVSSIFFIFAGIISRCQRSYNEKIT